MIFWLIFVDFCCFFVVFVVIFIVIFVVVFIVVFVVVVGFCPFSLIFVDFC